MSKIYYGFDTAILRVILELADDINNEIYLDHLINHLSQYKIKLKKKYIIS
ncbi:hypothetical protein [Clostridium beijerinckii]|uniref:Uncharacterized protein n=1 Tax=Clostridium beijerinckii TaxID=1520 RepID=A0A9Q5GUI1_CLOBE|nr:hypothetical protein [Clostridium beijerinckii]MBA2887361.1 hypothetical protein [Clostridium beijerinckii]MBA2902242.1 hypothetical protein [Clostridium beijerinckii]MBA2912065.1 hypothetical protein [Clostridium beijerinckii]MBA9015934.1 hypothetical protein [Clostridium beijerinckii]MBC2418330.1 hypothetical protein [Clostridium beijerinckii]